MILVDHQRGVLITAGAEQLWICLQNLRHIELPIPHQNMLINRSVLEVSEADSVVSNHDLVVCSIASCKEAALYAGTSAGPTDDASAIQYALERSLCFCPYVYIHKPPLCSSAEEDPPCIFQWCYKLVRIRYRLIVGMEHCYVCSSPATERYCGREVVAIGLFAACCWDDHYWGIRTASELDDLLVYALTLEIAANDYEMAVLGTNVGCVRTVRRGQRVG